LRGFAGIERAPEFDDAKYRSAGIRMVYPVATDHLYGVKEGILLEVGFDDTAPNQPCDISSWALDVALKSPVAFIDNRALGVPCYSPAYTFVEKLQTVSTKFRNQQALQASGADAAESFPKNFLRHYYDLYCLLQSPEDMLRCLDEGEIDVQGARDVLEGHAAAAGEGPPRGGGGGAGRGHA